MGANVLAKNIYSKCSPILLFVYARPEHTKKTLESLQKNILADKSDLIIFSDAPKNDKANQAVMEVRKIIREITGFKTVEIIEREENYGLAKSIIEGVSSVINKYGQVIVLEDDIVTSPFFLQFMNLALNKYKEIKEVWHISGWNYPIDAADIGDAFFWRVMNCWGWATWSDRWAYYEKNPQQLVKQWSRKNINLFNLGRAHNFWSQVTANESGQLNTWAIFWYATIFEQQGLCLNPAKSFVKNIGLDGSGENCTDQDVYLTTLNNSNQLILPEKIEESTIAMERIRQFYLQHKPNIIMRILNKLKRTLFS